MAASRWLADSGCFYIFVWTNNCSSWDGSVDLAKLEQFENGQIYVVIFIMMSWHNGEPPQEMVLLAKYSAQHQTIELENMHFLQIGSADRHREFKDL